MPQRKRKKAVKKTVALGYAWMICLLAAIFYGYDFVLRVTPSIMIHPLMQHFNITAAGIGFLSAFYYYAYTPMQIPAGLIVDRYRLRFVLSFAALCCTVGAFLFVLVDNLYIAFFARALMGFGSAFAFVGALKLGETWLPHSQFAFFTGLTTAIGTLGAMGTDIVLTRMLNDIGWQRTVYLTALLGVVLTVFIFVLVRSAPKQHKKTPNEFPNWSRTLKYLLFMISKWRFWINGIVGALLFLPVSVFASLWGVAFLKEAYHLTQEVAATAVSFIFLGMALGGPTAGWFSDKIQSRRVPIFVGTLAALAFSLIIIFDRHIELWLLYPLLFLLGFSTGSQILVFSIAREISPPKTTGTSSAATNFIVTMGAAIFQPLIGMVLVWAWQGHIVDGVHYYSVANYEKALLILPILLLISFFLTFLLPRTRAQLMYRYDRKGNLKKIG